MFRSNPRNGPSPSAAAGETGEVSAAAAEDAVESAPTTEADAEICLERDLIGIQTTAAIATITPPNNTSVRIVRIYPISPRDESSAPPHRKTRMFPAFFQPHL
jgi:hypothetical protein